MADEGIRVTVNPSSGKRLAESPSFAADKYTGSGRFAAPGADRRSEINVEKKIAESQVQLVAELKQLRTAMRRTALSSGLQSPEYRALQARDSELRQIQRTNLGVAFAPGAAPMPGAAARQGQSQAQAYQPGTRAGDVLRGIGSAGLGMGAAGLGVAGAAWSGQSGVGIAMLGADLGLRAGIPIARGAWGLGKSAIGAAFGAGAGEAAGEAGAAGAVAGAAGEAVTAGTVAESATGVLAALGGWPVIVTAVTAALGVGAYELVKNRAAVSRAVSDVAGDIGGLPRDLVALALARNYGAAEVPRQASAYRFGRSFQESGQSMVGASTGGRWSALGLTAPESTAMLGGARELAGADILSNAQAYRAIKMGTFAGLTNEQTTSAVGGFARIGADAEQSIRIVSEGVLRAGEHGLQGETAKAALEFFRAQTQRTVIQNPSQAVAGVSAFASMFQASRIPALRGAGAIDAISSIGAAFDSSSLLDETKIGQSVTMMGQAKLLAAMQTAKHLTGYTDAEVAKMTPSQRMMEGLRTMDRAFTNTGPDLSLFLKNAVAPTLQAAKSNPLLLDSIEKAWGLARGQATDRMLTDTMLPEAMTGNYAAFNANMAKVKIRTTGMIAPGAAGEARLSHTEAATGERVMGTYVKTLDAVEKKSLDVLDAYLAGGTATPLPGGAAGASLRARLKGTGAMSALPSPTAPDYGHETMPPWAGGGPGAASGIAAAIAWGIRAIIADLDKLVEFAAHLPSPGTSAYPSATPPVPPSHPAASGPPAHGKVVPPAHKR